MINPMGSYPPALILIVGALIVPFLKGRYRQWFVLALPLLTFGYIWQLDPSTQLIVPFLGHDLNLLRPDAWSKVFGYVFTLSAFATFLYGFYQNRSAEYTSALLYIGSALGVVFSGDLISFYVFWELMAITSVYLILVRRSKKSQSAGTRYVIVHIFGGLVLLAGILFRIQETGSVAFVSFHEVTLGTILILAGFLVNAAAVPVSSWLPDAYPEASVMGGVILSAYTSKTAVYALIRGFPGWDILLVVGCIMAVYGIIYALLENDMRRILAYSIINQVGFMVVGVGIGTPLALAGAAAHAFCHIIYKALLWMSAGAVLHRTGKSKCTDLGGLYRTMPLTFIFGTIGALAISAVPLTSGFTSKTIILAAAQSEHMFWIWLVLEIASAGVFLHAGIKFPYFVFFAKDKGLRPKEAPKGMLLGMGFLSAICIYLGCFPKVLYDILPNSDIVKAAMPVSFSDIYIHHFPHVVSQFQLLIFSAIVFFLFLPLLKRTNTISIDFDWAYRKGWGVFHMVVKHSLETINRTFHYVFVEELTTRAVHFAKNAPGTVMVWFLTPIWIGAGFSREARLRHQEKIYHTVSRNAFPVGFVGILAILFLGILVLL